MTHNTQNDPQQNGLPCLSQQCIERMIRTACAQKQQCCTKHRTWLSQWTQRISNLFEEHTRMVYGASFGAVALTTACLAFVVFSPANGPILSQATQSSSKTGTQVELDTEISDMMLYDLLRDLT